MPASLSTVAARLSFIRETEGPNAGYWVNFLQRFCDGVEGDSWCADFESFVEDVAYKGKNLTPRTGSSDAKLRFCKAKGWIVAQPQLDDLYFYVHSNGVAHHIGIVSGIAPLTGIAGNTSKDGRSSNGDGVYDHAINAAACVFARLSISGMPR